MCGLAGFIGNNFLPKEKHHETLMKMGATIARRGPDSEGIFIDDSHSFGVVHRRLAVIDTSVNGNQPMRTQSGRYTLAYNGEIYNFQSIRSQLSSLGRIFHSTSDTEVLLQGIEQWGLESMLQKVRGMFSIVLWDAAERLAYFVTDRAGEKPLYYGRCAGSLIFSSSLDSFSVIDKWQREIDTTGLVSYLKYGYVPHGQAILQGATKLAPGKIVRVKPLDTSVELSDSSYWQLNSCYSENASSALSDFDYSNPVDTLENLLTDAVTEQLVADVPVGMFLSGGVDSSLVTALAQAKSSRPIKTFSIGFESAEFNEAGFAREVANILGTDHCEVLFSNSDLLNALPKLPLIYDEPFSDMSQLPTQLLSAVARENVTVALTGDGGDELFGGYSRYLAANNIWKKFRYCPEFMQIFSARLLQAIPDVVLDKTMAGVAPWYAKYGRVTKISEKIKKSCSLLPIRTREDLYQNLVSVWKPSDNLIKDKSIVDNQLGACSSEDYYSYMIAYDFNYYLSGDILTKVDRAAMYSSLETRIPFLDKRIIEFSQMLQLDHKIRGDCGKWIVKQVLSKHLPDHLIFRPKKGFSVPIQQWLLGASQSFFKQNICEPRECIKDIVDYSVVQKKWNEHETGRRNWQYQLWNIFMLHTWLDQRNL